MGWEFDLLTEALKVVVIPIALAVLALTWPTVQSRYRRRVFQRLILRELEELSPYPEEMKPDKNWLYHQNKKFIHQEIFRNPSKNRDFILSLDPNLVYFVSQLWNIRKHEKPNDEQWLWNLENIYKNYDKTGKIKEVYDKWKGLIDSYNYQSP
jgi:hypothetical protein